MADVEGGVLSLYPTVPAVSPKCRSAENRWSGRARCYCDWMTRPLARRSARPRPHWRRPRHSWPRAQGAAATPAPGQPAEGRRRRRPARAGAARLTVSRKEDLAKNEQVDRKEADAAAEQVKKLEAAIEAEQAKLDALELRDPAQEVRKAEADVVPSGASWTCSPRRSGAHPACALGRHGPARADEPGGGARRATPAAACSSLPDKARMFVPSRSGGRQPGGRRSRADRRDAATHWPHLDGPRGPDRRVVREPPPILPTRRPVLDVRTLEWHRPVSTPASRRCRSAGASA